MRKRKKLKLQQEEMLRKENSSYSDDEFRFNSSIHLVRRAYFLSFNISDIP